jgi:hypothetical protein
MRSTRRALLKAGLATAAGTLGGVEPAAGRASAARAGSASGPGGSSPPLRGIDDVENSKIQFDPA